MRDEDKREDRRDDRQGERLRKWSRRKIFHPVELRIGGGSRRAHLLDLSAGGALAHCRNPPTTGASLVLVIGGALHTASVVWQDGLRFGLAFRFRLDRAEIDRIVAQATVAVGLTL
ncbi:PilZ domain-containing protein [Sphingomonas sp. MMS24-J45]|uniref:PilZ domain-containing protein n=1 Tax=Sphingomonas sp. MMS24-J45 TaxID=3238806 RepID=UPI00384DDB9A